MTDTWACRDCMWTHSRDLLGYDVEATDASIGTIDQASYDASDAYVVVDTGFWIFGRKRLMPAGAIASVDRDSESVHVTMTRQQVKSAPDYDSDDGDLVARSRRNDFYRSFLRQHRRHTIGSGPHQPGPGQPEGKSDRPLGCRELGKE